jgi:hypothetical protein
MVATSMFPFPGSFVQKTRYHAARYFHARQTGITRRRGCPTINGRSAYCRDANRSPYGPPCPEQRRQSSYGARSGERSNACSHRQRTAGNRYNESERHRSGAQRARRANPRWWQALVRITGIAIVKAARAWWRSTARKLKRPRKNRMLHLAACAAPSGRSVGAHSDGHRGRSNPTVSP